MPADAKPRWITVRQPFSYYWPGRRAVSAFREPGEQLVKAEVADFAVAKGYATEGKADGSEARAPKGKRERKRRKARATKAAGSATPVADAGPDIRANEAMGGTGVAADDSANAGSPVAPAAE